MLGHCVILLLNDLIHVSSGTRSWYVKSVSDLNQTDQANTKQVRLVKSKLLLLIVTEAFFRRAREEIGISAIHSETL